jgi:hypothetical protein
MRPVRLLGLTVVACLSTIRCSPPTPFKPVMTVKELMRATIEPLSNDVFDAAVWVNGVPTGVPTTDQEWEEVKDSALTLAEAGNLLMMAPRARDSSGWMIRAHALVGAATAAAKATDSKDFEQVFRAGGRLDGTCDACHNLYPPLEAPMREPGRY